MPATNRTPRATSPQHARPINAAEGFIPPQQPTPENTNLTRTQGNFTTPFAYAQATQPTDTVQNRRAPINLTRTQGNFTTPLMYPQTIAESFITLTTLTDLSTKCDNVNQFIENFSSSILNLEDRHRNQIFLNLTRRTRSFLSQANQAIGLTRVNPSLNNIYGQLANELQQKVNYTEVQFDALLLTHPEFTWLLQSITPEQSIN